MFPSGLTLPVPLKVNENPSPACDAVMFPVSDNVTGVLTRGDAAANNCESCAQEALSPAINIAQLLKNDIPSLLIDRLF